LFFPLAVLASLFKSNRRLAAENAALRQQLIVLRRQVRGRVRLTNNDRLFFATVPMVSIGSEGDHDHPSRHPGALASGGLSLLLALEVSLPWRASADRG